MLWGNHARGASSMSQSKQYVLPPRSTNTPGPAKPDMQGGAGPSGRPAAQGASSGGPILKANSVEGAIEGASLEASRDPAVTVCYVCLV